MQNRILRAYMLFFVAIGLVLGPLGVVGAALTGTGQGVGIALTVTMLAVVAGFLDLIWQALVGPNE